MSLAMTLLAVATFAAPPSPELLLGSSIERLSDVYEQQLADLAADADAASGENAFWAAVLAYRYAVRLEGKKQRKEALRQCVQLTQREFEPALEPLSLALRSSCLGSTIALSPVFGGMRHGAKARAAIDEALVLAPDHPYVQLHKAMSETYTPGMWGGDMESAAARLDTLVSELQTDSASPWYWLLADALGHLAIASHELDRRDAAEAAYDRAIALQPAYEWLKNVVRPHIGR